ncbi:transcription factor SCREAM2-like [Punica granatum]|uniref:Plant bHLH transcription factor ACT-like domain-containing protein n=2 Tax=Punica granatum TaxID=22663 RepID=A0A2I0I9C4_PUNGR|nr:transcription factor SCREAM2-like [Punica granatum]PKI40614.1 hypothetical protein CRG98_039024 [Punica granatum]
MVSREHQRSSASALHEKLQLLRSVTHSHAANKTSILVDASKYIEELKQKVERLNQDMEEFAESSSEQSSLPMVTVETLEKGFLINVFSDKSCPGLLVSILEAFEELNLNVLEARVSCTESFRLQAVGGESEDQQGETIGAQVVKQAVVQSIKKWSEGNDN